LIGEDFITAAELFPVEIGPGLKASEDFCNDGGDDRGSEKRKSTMITAGGGEERWPVAA